MSKEKIDYRIDFFKFLGSQVFLLFVHLTVISVCKQLFITLFMLSGCTLVFQIGIFSWGVPFFLVKDFRLLIQELVSLTVQYFWDIFIQ